MTNSSRFGRISLLSVTSALALTSCMAGETGDTAADKTGDTSNPAMVRGRPDVAFFEACGSGELTTAGAAAIHRRPYLQQVTAQSARILWTDAAPGQLLVDVTTPDGAPVLTTEAIADDDARPANALQRMVVVDGLDAGTTYCYAIRDGSAPLTERTGFRTAPERGSEAPVTFVAFGDSGDGSPDQYDVYEQMQTVPLDFMIHLGDIVYPSGSLEGFETFVFDMYPELLRSFAFFPASGNHEYETEDAWPFREVFDLPKNGGPQGLERWYSYDWGNVHFVVLDTEKISAAQAAWLDADLTANDQPWVIVYGHRPPYSSGSHGSDMNFRQTFGSILEKHRVPLVLTGHDHHYERSKPQNGVIYVVSGGGGHGTRSVGESDFTAFSEQVLQFVAITINGDTLVMHAIDGTGKEFDSLMLKNTPVLASK